MAGRTRIVRADPGRRAALAFVPAAVASAVAFAHMSTLPGLMVIAPGYLVQTWLFERHWALGGAGYAATLIGVSALFWTVVLLTLAAGIRRTVRFFGRRTR